MSRRNEDQYIRSTTQERKQYRIPKKIHVIKNPDKKNTESWTEARAQNIANIPTPARILFLGPPGVGKTLIMKNLILQQWPMFERVYLCHPDMEYSREWEDMELTECLDEIPELNFFEDDDGNFPKTCLVVDDMEFHKCPTSRIKRMSTLLRYASTHRCMSIYLSFQSFFDLYSLARKLGNVFCIWKPRALNELETITNRVGIAKGVLEHIFNTLATGNKDFITIDLTDNSPAPLRLGLWKKIELTKEVQHDDTSDPSSSEADE